MPERKRFFMTVLKAELEDCIEDVEDLAAYYDRRRGKDLTEYVYRENVAQLTRELSGLKNILFSIDDLSIDRYDSVESLAAAVDQAMQAKILDFEDPEAVYSIAKRKLLKVMRYVSEKPAALKP